MFAIIATFSKSDGRPPGNNPKLISIKQTASTEISYSNVGSQTFRMRAKSSLTERHNKHTRVGANFPAGKFGESEIQWNQRSVVCPKQSHKRIFVEVVPVHGQNYQNFPQDCSDRKSRSQVKIKEMCQNRFSVTKLIL